MLSGWWFLKKIIHEIPGQCFMYEFLFKSPFNFRNITFSYNVWAKWLEQALGIFGRPGRNVVSLPGPPSSPVIELSAGGVGFLGGLWFSPFLWWTEWFQLPLGGCDVSSPRFHPVFWGSCCGAITYLPWLRTVLHPAGVSKYPSLHRTYTHTHSGSAVVLNLCRFVGVGRVSYTDRSRKDIRKGSTIWSSFHVNLR